MTYQPLHLKVLEDSWDHCCFAGCTPMGCDGGCCANMGYHRAHCSLSPYARWAEQDHDLYVDSGMRKHAAETVTPPGRSSPARRCDCGNLVGPYGNGRCGPSGCQNVPA